MPAAASDLDLATGASVDLVGQIHGATTVTARGPVVQTVQAITVTDLGTGLGAHLLERLCVPLSDTSPVTAPEGETVDVRALAVTLAPAESSDRSTSAAGSAAAPVRAERPEPGEPTGEHTFRGRAQGVELTVQGAVAGLSIAHPNVAAQVLAHISHAQLERATPGVHLHGGAVTDAPGRAVLLLAPSGSGKSTLVAHLVHGGLDLVNDEQVALHHGGATVCAFTRPVAVKAGGVAHLPPEVRARIGPTDDSVLVTAHELGGTHRLSGQPVLVVLPQRDPTEPLAWDLLTPGEALEAFFANNLDLVRKPVTGTETFAATAAALPVVWLRYPDAASGAQAIRALLADPPAVDPVAWRVSQIDEVASADASAPDSPGRGRSDVHAVPGVVQAEVGDELVLFSPSTRAVARLDPQGRAVWEALAPAVVTVTGGGVADNPDVSPPTSPLPSGGGEKGTEPGNRARRRAGLMMGDGLRDTASDTASDAAILEHLARLGLVSDPPPSPAGPGAALRRRARLLAGVLSGLASAAARAGGGAARRARTKFGRGDRRQ